MKSIEKKLVQVRIPHALYKEIEEHAEIHGRSKGSETAILVQEAMAARNNTVFQFEKPKKK